MMHEDQQAPGAEHAYEDLHEEIKGRAPHWRGRNQGVPDWDAVHSDDPRRTNRDWDEPPPPPPRPRPISGLTWIGIGFVAVGGWLLQVALVVGSLPFPYAIGWFFAGMLCLLGVPIFVGGLLMLLIARVIDLVNAARARRAENHHEESDEAEAGGVE